MTKYLDADHWKVSQLLDELYAAVIENRALQLIEKLKPTLSKDGNQFCYLLGENLQVGIAGFGSTASEAMYNFQKAFWNEKITVKPYPSTQLKQTQ